MSLFCLSKVAVGSTIWVDRDGDVKEVKYLGKNQFSEHHGTTVDGKVLRLFGHECSPTKSAAIDNAIESLRLSRATMLADADKQLIAIRKLEAIKDHGDECSCANCLPCAKSINDTDEYPLDSHGEPVAVTPVEGVEPIGAGTL